MMITKSDLQKVNDELMAERRRALGDPPTTEELLAYSRGELSGAEEERVRELISVYPELARGIAEPFPHRGAAPGDDDYLSDEDFAKRWAALEKRLSAEGSDPAPVVRFHRRIELALAAMLVLAFGGMLLQAQANRRLEAELTQPLAKWTKVDLLLDDKRGPGDGAPTLPAGGDGTMLVLSIADEKPLSHYRAEIHDVSMKPPEVRKIDSLPLQENSSLTILLPQRFLSSGHTYRVVVFGGDRHVGSYTFHAR